MACSILSSTGGAVTIIFNLIFPSSDAIITVNTDAPAILTIPAITEMVQPVQGVDISGYLTLNPRVVSGPNTGATFTGSDSSARSVSLSNIGTHVIYLSVEGTLENIGKAGTYQINAVYSCI